jgi:hypothetical protein
MTNETEYLKVLNQGMGLFGMGFDLAALNKAMNQFWSGLTTLEQKSDFIDYIEFKYIPGYRVNMQQFSEMRDYTSKANEKLKLLEGWVLNSRKAIHSRPQIQQSETKKKQEAPKTFEELFHDEIFISPCIDVLKQIEPPLIDTECNYIGKLKGAFCVWIDEMQRQGIVKHFSDRKIFASLLPQRIKRFSIDESMFGKHQTKAEDQYRTDIKTLLSQIRLSQNSQSGKLGK